MKAWVEKAEHDLVNADHTLVLEEKYPFDTACFHTQQCTEKYLKALLLWRCIDFPRTHDLRLLLQLLPSPLPVNAAAVVSLNRYSIEGRYPGDWEPITRAEADRAVLVVRTVREAVRSQLPSEALVE